MQHQNSQARSSSDDGTQNQGRSGQRSQRGGRAQSGRNRKKARRDHNPSTRRQDEEHPRGEVQHQDQAPRKNQNDQVPSNSAGSGFDAFGLSRSLRRAVVASGYDQPRPIQAQTIPAALEGHDILGLAQTGTGKTAAFALPILQRLLRHPSRGTRALVLAPTRELAMQIDGEFRKLAKASKIRTLTVYGGVSERQQILALRKHPDIIVACPGRLLDFYRRGLISFRSIEVLVLDEADHMFDMGFLPDIRKILQALPEERQNLLFAATMPKEIRRLAEVILDQPHVAEIDHSKPAKTIDHALYPVVEKRKLDLVDHFVRGEGFRSAIVFTRTKHRAKRVARDLERRGHTAVALQGNMSQSARDRAMLGFRQGQFEILVATDIVARGIDVEQVSHVINYDVPGTPEAYMHRIGRTGRSERTGKAYTFVTVDDGPILSSIERRLGKPIELRRVEGFEEAYETATGAKRRSNQEQSGRRNSRRPARGQNKPANRSAESRVSNARRGRKHANPMQEQDSWSGDNTGGPKRGGHRKDGQGASKNRSRRPRPVQATEIWSDAEGSESGSSRRSKPRRSNQNRRPNSGRPGSGPRRKSSRRRSRNADS